MVQIEVHILKTRNPGFRHAASIDSNRTLTNSFLAEEDPDVPRPASGGDTVRPKGNPSRVFPRQTKSAAAASGNLISNLTNKVLVTRYIEGVLSAQQK